MKLTKRIRAKIGDIIIPLSKGKTIRDILGRNRQNDTSSESSFVCETSINSQRTRTATTSTTPLPLLPIQADNRPQTAPTGQASGSIHHVFHTQFPTSSTKVAPSILTIPSQNARGGRNSTGNMYNQGTSETSSRDSLRVELQFTQLKQTRSTGNLREEPTELPRHLGDIIREALAPSSSGDSSTKSS